MMRNSFDEFRFAVDSASTLPKFRQLARSLERFVREGGFAPGTRLPNDRRFAVQLATTPVTLSRALNELAASGILSRRAGAGTFVGHGSTLRRIGVVCHEVMCWDDAYVGPVLRCFHRYWQERGASVLSLQGGPECYEKFMADYRLGGLLVLVPCEEYFEPVSRLRAAGVPIVTVGYASGSCREFAFGTDHECVGAEAVDYLAELGHRRIGVVSGVPRSSSIRRRGYARGMWRKQLPVRPEWEIDWKCLAVQLARLYGEAEPPTALLVTQLSILPQVYIELARLGLNIPEDVSVVGFDDSPYIRQLNPEPTVFAQRSAEFTGMAAARLEEMIAGKADFAPAPIFGAELIERASTRRINIQSPQKTGV